MSVRSFATLATCGRRTTFYLPIPKSTQYSALAHPSHRLHRPPTTHLNAPEENPRATEPASDAAAPLIERTKRRLRWLSPSIRLIPHTHCRSYNLSFIPFQGCPLPVRSQPPLTLLVSSPAYRRFQTRWVFTYHPFPPFSLLSPPILIFVQDKWSMRTVPEHLYGKRLYDQPWSENMNRYLRKGVGSAQKRRRPSTPRSAVKHPPFRGGTKKSAGACDSVAS